MLIQTIDGGSEDEGAKHQPRWRAASLLFMILKLGLSALAISVVAFTVDVSAAWQRVVQQDLWLLAAAAAVMLVQIAIGGVRWHVILKYLGAQTSVAGSLQLFYIAVFFNNWLWGAVAGDMVRAWLSSRGRITVTTAVSSVILDRIAALAGVGVLVLLTAPLFVERVGNQASAFIPAAIAATGLVCIGILAQLYRLPLNWQRSAWSRGLQTLSSCTRMIFLRPSTFIAPLGLAVAAQIALGVSVYILGRSMDIDLTLLDSVILIQPVVLVTALPISIGGWGVRETAMIALFALVGVPTSSALALSVQLGLLAMLVAVPGGMFWLGLKHRTTEINVNRPESR